MKVLVGSRNPTKIGAVQDVFDRCFGDAEVLGIEVSSGVAGQPVGDETFTGAENRARSLLWLNSKQGLCAHYCVGIEGGVTPLHGRWFAFGAVCITSADGRLGFGVTSHFELPDQIVAALADGTELGSVIDELTGLRDTRLGGGAIGHLSQGRLDRRSLAAQGVFMALIPFLNDELFFTSAEVQSDADPALGTVISYRRRR
jgi:inosine/xanthosine triphosphatase